MGRVECSQVGSRSGSVACMSGHVPMSGVCFGCKGKTPPCMEDDRPAHLIQENGLPLHWPIESNEAGHED